jgi:hypothetical protein
MVNRSSSAVLNFRSGQNINYAIGMFFFSAKQAAKQAALTS